MNTRTVSIIIPVYNVEKYLQQCIDSVSVQTYSDLQIILVDDGSTDSSGVICDNNAVKDSRITVIHKSNVGLSDARNAGVAIASGDYLFFLDSDDSLEVNAIEELIKKSNTENADIVFGNYWYSFSNHEVIADSFYDSDINFDNISALQALFSGKLQTFAWGKLFRRDIASKYTFPAGKIFEDHFWTHKVFGDAKLISYVNIPLIHYRQRESSISYTYDLKRLDILDGWKDRISFIEEKYPVWREMYLQRCGYDILTIAWLVLTKTKKDKSKCFVCIKDFITVYNLDKQATGRNKALLKALKCNWILYSIAALCLRISDGESH